MVWQRAPSNDLRRRKILAGLRPSYIPLPKKALFPGSNQGYGCPSSDPISKLLPPWLNMGVIGQALSSTPPEARGDRMAAAYSGTAPASGFPAPWPGGSAETGAGIAPSPGTSDELKSSRAAMARRFPRRIPRGFEYAPPRGFRGGVPGKRLPRPEKLAHAE